MSYFQPDLTGKDPDYKILNDSRMIISSEQDRVSFRGDSVFFDSLKIVLVGTASIPFVYGQDWTVQPDDKDYDAMSAMRNVNSTFDKILLKSITLMKPYVVDYYLSMDYQRVLPVITNYALSNATTRLNVNPDLIASMLEDLVNVKLQVAPVDNVHSLTEVNPLLLELDQNKERPENYLENELHRINVPANTSIIHPVAGDFFRDSVSIKHLESKTDLVVNEDYIIVGPVYPKLKYTTNTSGVYRFILFIKSYVGTMSVSYHAYGGEATLYDMKAVQENINNVLHYITDAQILTSGTIATAPIIQNILNELKLMREEMRKFAEDGTPNYGDVTAGTALIKRITAADTDVHWWTIAELYKVAGSDTVFKADTGKFRIQTFYTKLMFDCNVAVDLTNPLTNLQVSVLSSIHPLYYTPYEDYSKLNDMIRPQFRIIWNDNTVEGSGMYLQIGFALKSVATETIAVEDMSGKESCFKLIPEKAEASYPEDDLLLLPSKNHVWDKTNVDSRVETYLIPFVVGNLVWAGTEPLNRPFSGAKHIDLTHFLEKEIDITRIKKIRYDLEEEGGSKFPVMLDVISGSEDLLGFFSFSYNGKPASFIGRVRRNTNTGLIEMSVDAEIVAGVSSNPLNLRQVVIYT